ncbi:hypothetical protein GGI25_005571 [Coemansia spiralis]|uniref:Secreted protein n=2 Tax=Coemansia TaxID=4863 RepID=A0A9W8KVL5_9FUNG|nr:hypothetical protein BX070DRAFT_238116 [Coemansia spiralis]KAJ1987811.1 hypothetical protein EDC05_005644 [Coemansia umbellata]KAJ2619452.1 hypothetical protein GGI26_005817 [Coemansia sp. RSA 1358]KAJ2671206.1 hypothetical protein GGI25_005571 [Coemansia spiralis]
MKLFTTLLLAATAVLAQVQEENQGPNLSSGSAAVSNPNTNNGEQFQGSFVDSSSSGQNVIDGRVSNSFNNKAANEAILGSNFVNPSKSSISGNVGDTASGTDNLIGDIFHGARRSVPFGAFRRRDAVFNNFGEIVPNRGHFGIDSGVVVIDAPIGLYPVAGTYPF